MLTGINWIQRPVTNEVFANFIESAKKFIEANGVAIEHTADSFSAYGFQVERLATGYVSYRIKDASQVKYVMMCLILMVDLGMASNISVDDDNYRPWMAPLQEVHSIIEIPSYHGQLNYFANCMSYRYN